MAVNIKKLNGDTTFLLSFCPSWLNPNGGITSPSSSSCRILLDPWLTGTSSIWHSKFQLSRHTQPTSISTLADLPIDVIVISQSKSDHCHRETLCTLPKDSPVTILAVPNAYKIIKSWRYFTHAKIIRLAAFNPKTAESVFRMTTGGDVEAYGESGEVTVTFLPAVRDITGLHSAIGITYRSPEPPHDTANGRPISILYCPHGPSRSSVQPYIDTVLRPLKAVPLTAVIHALNIEENPWFLGGRVVGGLPNGIKLVKQTGAKYWISAHDEDKDNKGFATRWMTSTKFSLAEAQAALNRALGAGEQDGEDMLKQSTVLMSLDIGEDFTM